MTYLTTSSDNEVNGVEGQAGVVLKGMHGRSGNGGEEYSWELHFSLGGYHVHKRSFHLRGIFLIVFDGVHFSTSSTPRFVSSHSPDNQPSRKIATKHKTHNTHPIPTSKHLLVSSCLTIDSSECPADQSSTPADIYTDAENRNPR